MPFCVGCGITTSLLGDLSRCSINGAEDGKALRKAVSVHRSDEKLAEGVLLPRRYLGEGGFLKSSPLPHLLHYSSGPMPTCSALDVCVRQLNQDGLTRAATSSSTLMVHTGIDVELGVDEEGARLFRECPSLRPSE